MWSVNYIIETAEEQDESIEAGSIDPVSSIDVEKDKYDQTLSVQESEEWKTESETLEGEPKVDNVETNETEVAIKRVEELVKQMSLSQDKEGELI